MIKNTLILTIFILVNYKIYSQINLIPNPSFEIHDTCPNTAFQIQYALGWSTYQNTPDYFNTCSSISSDVNVPHIFGGYGYQNAASGNAYAGLYSIEGSDSTGNEIIGCQLASSFIVGTKYYVSFKTNLSIIDSSLFANAATNHLGALFSTVSYNFNTPAPINNHPHVYTNTIITDTMNWIKVFGSFIADSAYKYIAIGNFFDSTHTQTTYFFNQPYHSSYYFIDDICVSTDSLYTTGYSWTGIEDYKYNQQQINLYPNPSNNGIIYINANLVNQQIDVYDVLGNLLKRQFINSNMIDLSYFDNGIYIVQFNNLQQLKQKVIINK